MAENVIDGPISCRGDRDALAARRDRVGVGDQHRRAGVGGGEGVDAGGDGILSGRRARGDLLQRQRARGVDDALVGDEGRVKVVE